MRIFLFHTNALKWWKGGEVKESEIKHRENGDVYKNWREETNKCSTRPVYLCVYWAKETMLNLFLSEFVPLEENQITASFHLPESLLCYVLHGPEKIIFTPQWSNLAA